MKKITCAPMPVQLSTEPERKSATDITLEEMQEERTAPLDARIKTLEGHRNVWRRLALRLYDELRKHDVLTAEAIFQTDDERIPLQTSTEPKP